MKKYLAIILGAVFVLGFAASAFAIHAEIPAETQAVIAKGQTQITIGGQLRMRGRYFDNTRDFDDDAVDRASFLETKVHLSIHAQITPNTEAMIEIRDSKNSNGDDDYTWGSIAPLDASDARGVYNTGDNSAGSRGRGTTLSFIQAWVQHKGSGLLGIPAGIKVGHMPLALGNNLFFSRTKNGEDAIVLFGNPLKELHIALVGAKFREGNAALNDDSTGYVGLFAYTGKGFNLSGDITYVDDQNNFFNNNPLGTPNGVSAHLWNFALRGDTRVGGLGLKADGEFQAGKITTPGADDVKFRGYMVMAGANYKVDPVSFGVDFVYGSGDNDSTDNKFKTFVTALDNTYYNTFIYAYLSPTAAGSQNTGYANTWYLQGWAKASLAKDLSSTLRVTYLEAAKTTSGVSKKIGTEGWLQLNYKIDRNLTYFVDAAYLWAGNFYKTVTGGKDPDNPVALWHGLILSF